MQNGMAVLVRALGAVWFPTGDAELRSGALKLAAEPQALLVQTDDPCPQLGLPLAARGRGRGPAARTAMRCWWAAASIV